MKTSIKCGSVLALTTAIAALSFGAAAQDTTSTEAKPAVPPVSAETQAPGQAATGQVTPNVPAAAAPTDQAAPVPGTAASTAMPQAAAGATTDTAILAPKDFMRQAYLANEFGIAAAQMALQKAQTSDAKETAQEILDDGLKVRQDMVTAIQSASSDMHFDQNWDDHYQGMLSDLKNANGVGFDHAWLSAQAEVTSTSAGLFQSYAETGSDAAVKTFAQNILPVLKAEATKLDAASSTSAGTAGR